MNEDETAEQPQPPSPFAPEDDMYEAVTVIFALGTPYFRWATGTPFSEWATGEPYLS